jgi:3-hydroxyacyl-CoA dehydrogenase
MRFPPREGALPTQIDKVIYNFGFPIGPYAMSDMAGLDVGWRNRKAKFHQLTKREQENTILDKICEMGRYGQKTGAGFYQYDDKRNATPDPMIEELILAHSRERGITRRVISDQEILERAIYVMINEGAKILEEGIAARPIDIDVVWLYGYGFPVYLGGPMFYADQVGLKNIYDAILRYRDLVGAEYWTPAPLLKGWPRKGRDSIPNNSPARIFSRRKRKTVNGFSLLDRRRPADKGWLLLDLQPSPGTKDPDDLPDDFDAQAEVLQGDPVDFDTMWTWKSRRGGFESGKIQKTPLIT